MNPFFIIAGIVVTVLGILSFAIIAAVFVWVYVLHNELNLHFEEDGKDERAD